MGAAPPKDGPDPGEAHAIGAVAAVAAVALTIAELCGFAVPGFGFPVPKLPPFPPSFDFPPKLNFAVALKCSLTDPVSLSDGGGRTGTTGLDEDPDYPSG